MTRLIAALTLFIAILLYVIGATAKVAPPEPFRAEPIAWCKDPYSEFTGIPFDPCDRVNRYWNI